MSQQYIEILKAHPQLPNSSCSELYRLLSSAALLRLPTSTPSTSQQKRSFCNYANFLRPLSLEDHTACSLKSRGCANRGQLDANADEASIKSFNVSECWSHLWLSATDLLQSPPDVCNVFAAKQIHKGQGPPCTCGLLPRLPRGSARRQHVESLFLAGTGRVN